MQPTFLQRSHGMSETTTSSAQPSTGSSQNATPPPGRPRAATQSQVDRLKHLTTLAEIKASQDAIKVYILQLPVKSSSTVIKILRDPVIEKTDADLQHLRRIVKPEFVPQHVRALFPPPEDDHTVGYMFVCPADQIPIEELRELLTVRIDSPFFDQQSPPPIITTPVPLYAPTTAAQATTWSAKYWPISYKNTNPYGPHPSFVARASAELLGKSGSGVAEKMRLASSVAQDSIAMRMGPRVGCVIIARNQDPDYYSAEEIVAVGADARWYDVDRRASRDGCQEPGNVMAHAVMRAIGMVAQKRLRISTTLESPVGQDSSPVWHDAHHDDTFMDSPLAPLEAEYFARDNLAPYGYLCCDLEIYVTHEPCVMCSMAVLHSRFARCIFGKRMPLTGGMTADAEGLGHGIFWRPSELNWKLPCWEWDNENNPKLQIDEHLHA